MRNNIYKLLLPAMLLMCGCHTLPPKQPSEPDIPIEKFQATDIVFRLGRTIESNLIATAGNDDNHYSHVGILVNHNDSLKVIHIEPSPTHTTDIIKAESLQDFFSIEKSLSGCVARFEELSSQKCNTIQTTALQLLTSRITFDHEYLLSDTCSMYCTELIEYIFNSAEISLSQGRSHALPFLQEPILLPSDLSQNSSLVKIWSY